MSSFNSIHPIFDDFMQLEKSIEVIMEPARLTSRFLERTVDLDFYLPADMDEPGDLNLLLINDGQDLVTMGYAQLVNALYREEKIQPMISVGIHCGPDRKNEYGMVGSPSSDGLGSKAALYKRFILEELLPFIAARYPAVRLTDIGFAGFSLGGLMALDIVWRHPELFNRVGVFSGALWWRSRDKNDKLFNEATDRLMHKQIRESNFQPGLRFFFECGELDETADRNNNGVIDSIDDTIDVIRELSKKGYREGRDIRYLQLPDGRHNVASWGKAMPVFLQWGWRNKVRR